MTGRPIELLLEGWVHLDAENLAARLALAIRQLITVGLLAPGEQLPSERLLAQSLHVSRPTVSAALNHLRDAGMIVSRQGSGTRVAPRGSASDPAGPGSPFTGAVLRSGAVNLAAAVPFDASHLPGLGLSVTDLLTVLPDHGVAPLGLDALRVTAARRLDGVGLKSSPEQIVVTAGGHHALKTVFDIIGSPTAPVLVEEFTYGAVIDLAERHGTTLVGLPADEHGVDPDRLAAALKRTRPAFVLLATSIHSPSGQATSRDRLRELAGVLDAHRVPVVIDETYAELHHHARPVPLASLVAGPTITIESVSKTGWAGLRTGWIRFTPDLRTRVLPAFERDLGQPVPSQLLALRVLERYADLLPARRRDLERKSALLRDELANHLPDWRTVAPDGGLTTWVDTGRPDATPVVAAARDAGLLIAPGQAFHHRRDTSGYVRLCHDRPEALITTAAAKLRALTGG